MTLIIILIALVACLAGAVIVSRGIRLAAYASNRGDTSTVGVVFTILGSLVGGFMFFGLCAIGFEAGVVGYVIGLGYGIGLTIIALAIPRIKRAMNEFNCDTMDDFIGARYGSTAQKLVTCVNLSFFVAVLAAQFLAMDAFLSVFVESDNTTLTFSAIAVLILYTALSGFKGVLLTDHWQFWVLSIAALLISSSLFYSADWDQVRRLPTNHFNGLGYGGGFLFGVLVLFPPSLLARTDLWQRIAAAKDERKARFAFLVSIPVLLAFYFALTSVGILGRAALGDSADPETSGFLLFLSLVRDNYGNGFFANTLLGLISLGVFGALLSTADTNLNIVSIAVSKVLRRKEWQEFESDVADKRKGPPASVESSILGATRLVTIFLGAMSVAVSILIPNIVNLIVAAGSAVLVFLPCVVGGLLFQSRNSRAAIVSLLSGILTLIPLMILYPKIAFIPAFLASAISFAIAALVFRTTSTWKGVHLE